MAELSKEKLRKAWEKGLSAVLDTAAELEMAPRPGQWDSKIQAPLSFRETLGDLSSKGVDVGWEAVKLYYRPAKGQWTVMTGVPGHGKTSVLDCMMLNLMRGEGWKFAVFSAENQPTSRYIRNLIVKLVGVPFSEISQSGVDGALKFMNEHLSILKPDDDECNLDCILDMAHSCICRDQIDALIIDPWNELDHKSRGTFQMETEYISESLSKIRRFSREHNIHIWVVAHPSKLFREKDGKLPKPNAYDISGSSHWFNKCDFAISVWRNVEQPEDPTEVRIHKARFLENGTPGIARLIFQPHSGKYFEVKQQKDLPICTT